MLKATGLVRRVDNLGRLSLPKELRKKLEIKYNDYLEIYIQGEEVVLYKSCPKCIFCFSSNEVIEFRDKFICKECINTFLVIETFS